MRRWINEISISSTKKNIKSAQFAVSFIQSQEQFFFLKVAFSVVFITEREEKRKLSKIKRNAWLWESQWRVTNRWIHKKNRGDICITTCTELSNSKRSILISDFFYRFDRKKETNENKIVWFVCEGIKKDLNFFLASNQSMQIKGKMQTNVKFQ